MSASAYYQRLKIVNYSGVWSSEEEYDGSLEPKDDKFQDTQGWDLQGVAETKRLPGILEMMEKKIRITATSMRANAKGTMGVLARIIERNQKLINDYNDSLE